MATKVHYPGNYASLVCENTGWDVTRTDGPYCRKMILENLWHRGGLEIKEVGLVGYWNREIELVLKVQGGNEFSKYLEHKKCLDEMWCRPDGKGEYRTRNLEEMGKIFDIVFKHNNVTDKNQEIIRAIVKGGICDYDAR